jgi:hypothetical protein
MALRSIYKKAASLLNRLTKRLEESEREKIITVEAKGSVQVIAVKIPASGGTSAVRSSSSEGQSSEADIAADELQYEIRGTSRQGEEGAINVCRILIERLNLAGANWQPPEVPEGPEAGVDCVTRDGTDKLFIQVTRAVSAKSIWQLLNETGCANAKQTIDEAADDLRDAIKRKEVIPLTQRGSIVLALDAIDSSGHALSAVIDSFRRRFGTEITGLGFRAIYIVGPVATLVIRLDQREQRH